MPAQKLLSKLSQTALVGLAVFFLPVDAYAIEWSLEPSVSVGTSVNDNINLETTPSNTVWASNIAPQLTLSASSSRSILSGRGQINRIDYSDQSVAPSRTNGLLDLTFTRKYERSQMSLAGNLTRDSTLESELVQTGIVTSRAQRTSRNLSPSWSYSLSEQDTINLGYSYNDVSYNNTTTNSYLLDYKEKDPSITLSHQFSMKNAMNLSFGYSDYQSQNPISPTTSQYKFTTTSAQLGFTRDLSETMSISLTAGVHKTDSKINYLTCLPIFTTCFPVPGELDNSDTGTLFKATLQQQFESSNLTTELSRSLQPTADGGLVQSDRLSGSYGVKLTPTLSSSLDMSFYKTQSSAGSRTSDNSRYYNISPALTWQMTEWWSARTSYTRSVSKHESGTDASSNAINLTVVYNWPKISVSR